MRSKSLIESWNEINDGRRTIIESMMIPEVQSALTDWAKAKGGGVIIGGAAISYHGRARMTIDVDVLFIANKIPDQVDGFKRIRPHAFQHNDTHVEVEVLTGSFLGIPEHIIERVYKTAVTHEGLMVASKLSMVVLKLNRFSRQDQADIETLIGDDYPDLDDWNLPNHMKEHWDIYRGVK